MSSPSQLDKTAAATEHYLTEKVIPTLPDDLLLMIFNELTTDERSALAVACKRFRELDFKLGKRTFDEINIDWTLDTMCITGHNTSLEYSIFGGVADPIQLTNHSTRLFRNSFTIHLNFKHMSSDCDPSEFRLLSHFLENIRYGELRVSLRCEQACTEHLINTLVNDRSLGEKSQVFINLWTDGHEDPEYDIDTSHNLARTREMLTQLPKMNNFKLDWLSKKNEFSGECILNDTTLLHIALNVNHAELDGEIVAVNRSACTPQGILDAFQVVCQAPCYKFIQFRASTACLDDLFTMHNPQLEKHLSWEKGYLIDRMRGAILIVSHSYYDNNIPGYWRVQMGKIVGHDLLNFENVLWTAI